MNQNEMIREMAASSSSQHNIVDEFKNSVEEYGVVYAIEWGESMLLRHENAALWQRVHMELVDNVALAPVDALERVVNNCERDLLRNNHRSSSTSLLANAVQEARREAKARFVSDGRGMIRAARSS